MLDYSSPLMSKLLKFFIKCFDINSKLVVTFSKIPILRIRFSGQIFIKLLLRSVKRQFLRNLSYHDRKRTSYKFIKSFENVSSYVITNSQQRNLKYLESYIGQILYKRLPK